MTKIGYWLFFIVGIFAAMFLGGLSGVAGTFYLMVNQGDVKLLLPLLCVGSLLLLWIVIKLRQHNIKKLNYHDHDETNDLELDT